MSWSGKSEGGALGFRIFVSSIKTFGLSFAYFMLGFVTFYYYLFLTGKKKILDQFYQVRLGYSQRESRRLIRRNFQLLGEGLVDKIAFMVGRGDKLGYTQQGETYLIEAIRENKGLFLLSGHLGNWDIAGNFLSELGAKVNVVMYQNEKEQIRKLLEKEGVRPLFNIIPIRDDLSHLIAIYNAIRDGEFVCMHADRYLPGDLTLRLPFFGSEADFPAGVFMMVEKLRSLYTFVFMVKKSKYSYYFTVMEPEAGNKPALEIAREFVNNLEEKVREFPEQWYNYYDFYQKNDAH